MKKRSIYLIFIMLLFISCGRKDKATKINIIKPGKVINLEAISSKRKIKLQWDFENMNHDKIFVIKHEPKNKKIKFELEKNIKSFEIDVKPVKKAVFSIKLIKGNRKGEEVYIKVKPELEVFITNEGDFYETTSDTVKFLFKTNLGANVKILLGTNKFILDPVYEKNNYRFSNGIKVKNLKPNQTYFYKIISEKEGKKAETEILYFVKQEKNQEILPSAQWAKEAIFYEIFVRSFYDSDGDGIGDLNGITAKLDYLKELGVNAVWLMPITKSGSYHGYDVLDYYEIDEDYGTMEDFENLMREAHLKDIKIIMDLVLNHTSHENKWFLDAYENKDSKYRNFFNFESHFDNTEETGLWDQEVWSGIPDKEEYYAVFGYHMPDLNYRNLEVREEMKNVAKFWLNKGIDGFRLDATRHIDNDDKEVTLGWWKEFNDVVKGTNPEAFLVSENTVWDPNELGEYMTKMDSSFNFIFGYEIQKYVNGKNDDFVKHLKSSRKIFSALNPDFVDSTFVTNHDYDRTFSIFRGKENKVRLAYTLLLTLPGTPYIYYGDEIAQRGKKPDELVRAPFEWYKEGVGEGMTTWEKVGYNKPNDGISVEEQTEDETSFYNYIKKIIKIRKENPVLNNADIEIIELENGLEGFESANKDYAIKVIYNRSKESKEFKLEYSSKLYELLTDNEVKEDKVVLDQYELLIIKY